MKDWADLTVEAIGDALDHTPHRDNAEYVEHFRQLVGKELREAYRRGKQDQRNESATDHEKKLRSAIIDISGIADGASATDQMSAPVFLKIEGICDQALRD